jgi:tripartite motif-containing protein 71
MTASPALTQPAGVAPEAPSADEPEDRRRRKLILLLLLLAAFIALLLLAIWYLLFRQPIRPTIPLVPDTALPAYTTSMYGVDRPYGVAVTAGGERIYATQTNGDYGVLMFDAGGNQVGTFDTPSGASHVPVYVAIDPVSQDVYVSDRPAGKIWVYDANGAFKHDYLPAVPVKGWEPLGIAFDRSGNLYVTDVGAQPQLVEEFDRDGTLVRTIGGDQGMAFPNGVAVDAAGTVYVTDGNNGRLLAFGPNGEVLARVGRGAGQGNLGLPRGVVVGGNRVYVADSTGQAVFVYAALEPGQDRMQFVGVFGSQGIGDGQFQFPNGIAVDGRGRVYVTDSGNDRVQTWSY